MKLTLREYALKLRHTFTISRGSQDVVPILIAEIESEGIVGYGETSPNAYYGQTVATVREAIESVAPWFQTQNPFHFRTVLEEAQRRLNGNTQALCALDLALHDWVGKKLGAPLYQLLGLDFQKSPPTSYTVGIATISEMIAKLKEFEDFPIFKVKLGTPEDLEIIRALRNSTAAIFRVDANCGWGVEETLRKAEALKTLGVEFIEQPLPGEKLEEMEDLFGASALPLVADENSVVPTDVPELAGRFHGINIKLVKCGGIQPALRMIASARAFGMKVMIGCMIESSCACAAAAQLGPLADWLDLDGPLLISNDPFGGMKVEKGRIILSGAPGLGVTLR